MLRFNGSFITDGLDHVLYNKKPLIRVFFNNNYVICTCKRTTSKLFYKDLKCHFFVE